MTTEPDESTANDSASEESSSAAPQPSEGQPAAGVPPTPPTPPTPPAPPSAPRRLTRSRTDRVIGGVAGGLGHYLNVDPVIIRIAWVALFLFGGTGLLLYILAWIIIPEEPTEDAQRRAAQGDRQPPSEHASAGTSGALVFAVVLIGIGVIALLRSLDVDVPSWQIVLSAGLALVGAGLIAQARYGLNGGLVAIGILLSVILAGAGNAHVGININTDSAFSDQTEAPRTADTLKDSYSHAFGSFTLDLGELDLDTLPRGTTRIEVDVAFGSIEIRHGGLPVRIEGSSTFGSSEDYESADYDTAPRRILIDVSSAFGSSEVRR